MDGHLPITTSGLFPFRGEGRLAIGARSKPLFDESSANCCVNSEFLVQCPSSATWDPTAIGIEGSPSDLIT